MQTQAITVSVVMQRLLLNNRWRSHQWRPLEVLPAMTQAEQGLRCLRNDENDQRWLFSGFNVSLFSDEAEGYFLNISSPQPCWFIMWRMEQVDGVDLAVPKSITLSYNEAARLMDGGEQVDTLPAGDDIVDWLKAFADQFYTPEQKRKRKKPSFEGGVGVDQMARQEGAASGS